MIQRTHRRGADLTAALPSNPRSWIGVLLLICAFGSGHIKAQSVCDGPPYLGTNGPEICVQIFDSESLTVVDFRGPVQMSISRTVGHYFLDIDIAFAVGPRGMMVSISGTATRTSPGGGYISVTAQGGTDTANAATVGSLHLDGFATDTSITHLGGAAGYRVGGVGGDIQFAGFGPTCPGSTTGAGTFTCDEFDLPVNEGAEAVQNFTLFEIENLNQTIDIPSGVGYGDPPPPNYGTDLLVVEYGTGDLYRRSPDDASMNLIGSTGLPDLGSLETTPDGRLFGFTFDHPAALYEIDPRTAAASMIGQLGIGVFEGGLAIAPDGTAYGMNQYIFTSPTLFALDLSTGTATTIGTLGGNHDINGLAFRGDGMLIGLDQISNSLLLIDPFTAQWEGLSEIVPTVGAVGGMTLVNGTGYFATAGPNASIPGSNELYSFDPFSGSHQLIGSFSPTIAGVGISGLAWAAGANIFADGFESGDTDGWGGLTD